VIGVAMAMLAFDVAFGSRFRKAPLAAPKKASAPPRDSRPMEMTAEEAAEEWSEFKRTKLRFLLLTMVLSFSSELLLWMLAPFYPKEAYDRGVSPEVVGLLFATHPIALCISSQFATWLMANVEPFVLLLRTLLLQAVFIAGFGLAGSIEGASPFVYCAAVNRFLLGVMSGVNEPTSQAITLRVVPSHAVAFSFGLIIAARFTAMLVGPAVGGALYTAGGFPLPFLVSGVLFLLLGLLAMFVGATTPIRPSSPQSVVSVWSLLKLPGVATMLGCISLLWFDVMALEPLYQPYLAAIPYNLGTAEIGLVLSAATGAMVLTMALSGLLGSYTDAYTQQTIGFMLLTAALPFLGPTPIYHLTPSLGLFIGSITLSYMAVGLVGPTQSVLCLRILSTSGLTQHEVASGLAAVNVTFSMIGSLLGPLISGAIVPVAVQFNDFTSILAAVTAVAYLPALVILQKYRPGRRPKPCAGCIHCCSFLNSCCCPCYKCCQMEKAEPSDIAMAPVSGEPMKKGK